MCSVTCVCMFVYFIRQESVTYYDGNHFENGIKSGTRGIKSATVNSYSVVFFLTETGEKAEFFNKWL